MISLGLLQGVTDTPAIITLKDEHCADRAGLLQH